MARVTREAAEAHKRSLVEAAGRLFREKGVDGVGVAEIGKAAGLTHGAIYSGFASKDELATAALKAGREASKARLEKALGAEPDLKALLAHYVSKRQRDDFVDCCPLLASASEAARQDDDYRQTFADIFADFTAVVQAAMARQGTRSTRTDAMVVAAGMIGAVAVARSLDDKDSEALLAAARKRLADLA